MNHIYESIPGWFSFPKLYSEMALRFPSSSRNSKTIFVEVGTYKGRSFSYLIVEIINAGKDIECIGIDACCWPDVQPDFEKHMAPLEGYYKFMVGESSEMIARLEDKSIDFAFIDANHTYDFVKRDILTILPKMKPGGILAGHDYGNNDYRPYPEIQKAVTEIFPEHESNREEDYWIKQL